MRLDARAFHTLYGQNDAVAVTVRDEGSGSGAGLANVAINSTPAGAEISVDQNFVGNTPSSLSLQPGEHLISVQKNGYQDWERKIKVSGGNVNLTAELTKGMDVPVVAPSTKPSGTTAVAQQSVTPIQIKTRASVQPAVAISTPPGWIGVSTKRGDGGVVAITALVPEGPAAVAGLKVGDTIMKLNGSPLGGEGFNSQISSYKFGSKVAVTYMRGSWASIVIVTVGVETL
jgi:PEGA domain/PDZ domain